MEEREKRWQKRHVGENEKITRQKELEAEREKEVHSYTGKIIRCVKGLSIIWFWSV